MYIYFCLCFTLQCLLLTATIYLLVPELNDLHGKSLACHSISLSLGFLLLALSQFHEMLLVEGTLWCVCNFNMCKTTECDIYIRQRWCEKALTCFSPTCRLHHSISHSRMLLLADCHVDRHLHSCLVLFTERN